MRTSVCRTESAVQAAAPERHHPDVELVLFEELSVDIPTVLADAGILDGGHPFAVEALDDLEHAGTDIPRVIRRRHHARDEPGGRFFQHAGWLTAGVAVDRAGWRIFRFLRDPGELEREAVGHTVVTGSVPEPHGVVRGGLIQIAREDIAALGELSFVPTGATHPDTRLQSCGPRADSGDDVGHALDRGVTQVQQVDVFLKVTMRVDQPRRRRPAMEIDHSRLRTDHGLDALVRADRHDRAFRNRHRFGDRVLRVDRQHRAVHQHQIRKLRLSRLTSGRS